MAETYAAILRGDRLEWTGAPPGPDVRGRPVAVEVAIIGDASIDPAEREARRRLALEALERLAARGTFAAEVDDSVAWQREVRRDRPLPGRDE